MAKLKKGKYSTKTEYTLSYSGMRGVDFTKDAVASNSNRFRFMNLENMYKDYEGGGEGIIESVPGFRKILSLGKRINSIFTGTDTSKNSYIIIHAKDSLYRFNVSDRDNLSKIEPIATLEDSKSCAYAYQDELYILDGKKLLCINGEGTCQQISENGDREPYIPTTYYNGKEYEQRNLLTNKTYEKWLLSSPENYSYGTKGLEFKITSYENKYCTLHRMDSSYGASVFVPAYVEIAGERYRVTEISDNAFADCAVMTNLYIPPSVLRIGNRAFYNCIALEEIVLGDCVEEIGNSAFLNSIGLKTLYLGSKIKKIGTNAFEKCDALEKVHYAADEFSLKEVDGLTLDEGISIEFGSVYSTFTLELALVCPTKEVAAVKVGDEDYPFYIGKRTDGLITHICLEADSASVFQDKEITVLNVLRPEIHVKNSVGTNFILSNALNLSSAEQAILGCTVCECFDGRFFLSGNPNLPNTVFYSSKDLTGKNNPTYYGVLNYFNDGVGSYPVNAMLGSADALLVFKAGDDGGGSIYYHTPTDTGIDIIPKIYPVSYIHKGLCALGGATSFFDDPVFICALGLCGIDKKTINLEKSISCRSHNVNPKLLEEDLSKISIAEWCGYLVLQAGGHIYLADSRQTFIHDTGAREYEWYYLSGIGTYTGSQTVYRYSARIVPNFQNHPDTDTVTKASVYSTRLSNGAFVYYTNENGKRYVVEPTEEKRGGTFNPASAICNVGSQLLFFGTESGDICLFNNDKRGIAPQHLAANVDFDAKEFYESYGRDIHPYYYSFDDHAPLYAVQTVNDNGNFPHLSKDTVKRSLVLKMKCFGKQGLKAEAVTDNSTYSEICTIPDYKLDFSDFDFSSMSFENSPYRTIEINEKQKGWVEKNLALYSKEFRSPFGICSITYRFTLKGRIKTK